MVAPSLSPGLPGVTTKPQSDRTARVLMLDPLDSRGFEEPIVLDQLTTHLRISSSRDLPSGQLVIERSQLGWRVRTEGGACLLNGAPVSEAWLHEGDRLKMSNTEFRVRPATTEELLDHLPRLGMKQNGEEAVSDRDLEIAARERDLAEWEQCLSDCEADIRAQEATVGQRAGDPQQPDLSAAWVLDELEGLRSNHAALDADRRRLQERMAELKRHRAILQAERERLAADRVGPRTAGTGAMRDVLPSAEAAEAVISSLSATIAAEIGEDAPGEAPRGRRPASSLMESRIRRNTLREVANRSTRRALSRHFWRQSRSTVALKLALVAMSFALALVLYVNHGAVGSPASTIAWGAVAIGLITTSGLVHTLSEMGRLNAGTREKGTGPDRPSVQSGASSTP